MQKHIVFIGARFTKNLIMITIKVKFFFNIVTYYKNDDIVILVHKVLL